MDPGEKNPLSKAGKAFKIYRVRNRSMANRKIIWSSRAKIDQFKILEYYYKRNGNKLYSQKLYKRFRNATKLLIKYPEIGVQTDILSVRNLIEGNYVIFYKFNENIIEIITIWDSRQDSEKFNF